MAKRYYLAPVVQRSRSGQTYNVLKVDDYHVNYVAEIPTGADGIPLFNWGIALVNAVNHAPLLADPEITALPDFPLDVVLNAMQSGVRNRMLNVLQAKGIDAQGLTSSVGFRDVIRAVGRHLNANFSEDNFDVAE